MEVALVEGICGCCVNSTASLADTSKIKSCEPLDNCCKEFLREIEYVSHGFPWSWVDGVVARFLIGGVICACRVEITQDVGVANAKTIRFRVGQRRR